MSRVGAGAGLAAVLVRGLYALAGAIAAAWTRVARLTAREPERRRRLAERLGDWHGSASEAGPAGAPTFWIHAASIGEVRVANRLARAVHDRVPSARLLLTCNTAAGRVAAGEPFDEVRALPLDHGPSVRKVLDRVAPALYVFVESEIWPVLLLELARRSVPAAMVNARISERSYRAYRMGVGVGRGLIRPALASLAAVCARDDRARLRLLALGAAPATTHLCGDLKLDAPLPAVSPPPAVAQLRAGGPLLVAASVRSGEIGAVAAAYRHVRRTHADVGLLLAPRYPRDADAAVAAVSGAGVRVVRRTELPDSPSAMRLEWDVLVLDTLGELSALYAGAVGAFVGGTLDGAGGHSLVEPAAYGLPLVTGPALDNVREHADELEGRGALVRVADADGLSAVWSEWLAEPERARSSGRAARAYVEESRGALERTMSVLEPLLVGAQT